MKYGVTRIESTGECVADGPCLRNQRPKTPVAVNRKRYRVPSSALLIVVISAGLSRQTWRKLAERSCQPRKLGGGLMSSIYVSWLPCRWKPGLASRQMSRPADRSAPEVYVPPAPCTAGAHVGNSGVHLRGRSQERRSGGHKWQPLCGPAPQVGSRDNRIRTVGRTPQARSGRRKAKWSPRQGLGRAQEERSEEPSGE